MSDNEELEDDDSLSEETDESGGKFNPLDGFTGEEIISMGKAVRAKCLECSTGHASDVKYCAVPKCHLYPFRMGKNPYRQKRIMTDEQKVAAAARMQKMHKAREKALKDKKTIFE